MQVVLAAGAFFVHQTSPSSKAIKTKFLGDRVRLIGGHKMRHAIALGGRRLKTTVTPSAIQIETVDMRLVDDR